MRRFLFACMIAGFTTTAGAASIEKYERLELGCAIFATDRDDCMAQSRTLARMEAEIPWSIIRISVETPIIRSYLDHLRRFITTYPRVWQYHKLAVETSES